MFYQKIIDKAQVEFPDYWLVHGNPWEIERQGKLYLCTLYDTKDVFYTVGFGGKVNEYTDVKGGKKFYWEPGFPTFSKIH